jgi:hypothetical protein
VRRWWIWLGLLLSLGVNAGILATLAVQHLRGGSAPQQSRNAPAPQPAAAEPRPNLPNVGVLADRLGLTGEKRRSFIEAQQVFVMHMREHRFRLVELQAELRAELVAEHPDRAKVESLTQRLGETYSALDRSLADNILTTRDLLTPEQQRRFLVFVEARLRQLRPAAAPQRAFPPRRRFAPPGP